MSLSAELKAVNCTSCGAGLDILGGGRVTVHICPYCGTELDALDNYRAIRQFNDIRAPGQSVPEIGMTGIPVRGRIHGDRHPAARGTLERARTWIWVDHQLYSPDPRLCLADESRTAIWSFTRRYRRPVWMSAEYRVERAEHRPKVSMPIGRTFQYYDTSTSQITFAEGEFTWSPVKGCRKPVSRFRRWPMTRCWGSPRPAASGRPGCRNICPVKDAEAGFGIKTGLKPLYGVHPLHAI